MKRTNLAISAIVVVLALGLPQRAATFLIFDSGPMYDVGDEIIDDMPRIVWSFDGSEMGESASIQFPEPNLVGLGFFARFASRWLHTDCGAPGWCTGADFEQNGRVDFEDLRGLVSYWLVGEPSELQDLLFRERQISWQPNRPSSPFMPLFDLPFLEKQISWQRRQKQRNVDFMVFLDEDFADGDCSGWTVVDEGDLETPSAWSAASGTMVQNSNIYSEPRTASDLDKRGTYAYYAGGLDWTEYQVDLTIRSTDDDAIGVMFRYKNRDNYYRFSWDRQRGYRRLVKKQAGVVSLLCEDSVPYVVGRTYQLGITAQGTFLSISIDGAPIFSVTDGPVASGSIALYTWGNAGSYFDDVLVERF
jgi:hypothetical protein